MFWAIWAAAKDVLNGNPAAQAFGKNENGPKRIKTDQNRPESGLASWQAGKLKIGLGDQNVAFSVTAETEAGPRPGRGGAIFFGPEWRRVLGLLGRS